MKQALVCMLCFLFLGLPLSANFNRLEEVSSAPAVASSFNGEYFNSEVGLHIFLDLDKESIEVPTMEFLGPMHGYMQGGIYGVWMLIKYELKGEKLLLRFSNDIGSDSQTIELSPLGENKYRYRAVGENLVRKAVGRRLVKIVDTMIMTKVEKK